MKQPSMVEIERLAESALKAKLIRDEAEEQYEERKAAFEEALERAHRLNSDFQAVGNVKVNITPNNSFNQTKALSFLTKKAVAECTVPTVDNKLLKAHLTGNQLKDCMEPNAKPWKVGFDVLTD